MDHRPDPPAGPSKSFERPIRDREHTYTPQVAPKLSTQFLLGASISCRTQARRYSPCGLQAGHAPRDWKVRAAPRDPVWKPSQPSRGSQHTGRPKHSHPRSDAARHRILSSHLRLAHRNSTTAPRRTVDSQPAGRRGTRHFIVTQVGHQLNSDSDRWSCESKPHDNIISLTAPSQAAVRMNTLLRNQSCRHVVSTA